MQPKLFVTIPSMYKTLVYNSYTKEIIHNGKVYATITNGIYYQKKNIYEKYVFWDLAVISYFHPKYFKYQNPKIHASITYEKLTRIGKRKLNGMINQGTIFTLLKDMQINKRY